MNDPSLKLTGQQRMVTTVKQTLFYTGKELRELWKTCKFPILCAVLLLFGMSSPLLAKLTPELFSQLDLGLGAQLQLPDATFLDAYAQFFKNITQICLIVLVLVLSGTIPHELKRGTAVLMLCKGLPRHSFVLSKYAASLLCWTAGYALSAAACVGYTQFLFPEQSPRALFLSMFALWLFGAFLLACVTLGGVLFSQAYAGALLTGGAVILSFLAGLIPGAQRFTPTFLASCNLELITGACIAQDILPALLVTAALAALLLLASVLLFRKKQL